MSISLFFRWKGMLFYLATTVASIAQIATTSQPAEQIASSLPAQQLSQNQSTIAAFQQEQQALFQERQALIAQGATPGQLAAWRQQNAARIAAQQQRVQAISAASALRTMPTNRQPVIPANASPTLRDFLTTQASLANARAQIHNQIVQQAAASGRSLTSAQISQMEQQQMRLFRQQHAADFQLQAQRAQTLANASAQRPMQPLPPLRIPPNASPQLQAFLTTQYQLMQGRVALQNEYANATPSARQAALQQWRQQNAGQIQQLQQQAQSLSQAGTPTQN